MRFFNNQQPLKRNSQVGNEFININFRLFTEKKIICIVCEQTLPVARKKYDLQYHYFNSVRMHVSSNNFSLIISAISAVKNL